MVLRTSGKFTDFHYHCSLNGCYGIPWVHYKGQQGDFYILVGFFVISWISDCLMRWRMMRWRMISWRIMSWLIMSCLNILNSNPYSSARRCRRMRKKTCTGRELSKMLLLMFFPKFEELVLRDKREYAIEMKKIVEREAMSMLTDLLLGTNDDVKGIRFFGMNFYSSSVVLTIGIFMSGKLAMLLWSYFSVVFTPGGVPPNYRPLVDQERGEMDPLEASESVPLATPDSTHTRIRYYRKCNQLKLPWCHHCSVCGRCVLKMDHHCVWVVNCVGPLNYKYFLLFLTYNGCWRMLNCLGNLLQNGLLITGLFYLLHFVRIRNIRSNIFGSWEKR